MAVALPRKPQVVWPDPAFEPELVIVAAHLANGVLTITWREEIGILIVGTGRPVVARAAAVVIAHFAAIDQGP